MTRVAIYGRLLLSVAPAIGAGLAWGKYLPRLSMHHFHVTRLTDSAGVGLMERAGCRRAGIVLSKLLSSPSCTLFGSDTYLVSS